MWFYHTAAVAFAVATVCEAAVDNTPPKGWKHKGCWSNSPLFKQLNGPSFRADRQKLTEETCTSFCKSRGYPYAGLNPDYCYCGEQLGSASTLRPGNQCATPCRGNKAQKCGGEETFNVLVRSDPKALGFPAGWKAQGCYTDPAPRTLQVQSRSDKTTINACVRICDSQGFKLAGLRGGNQCLCGNKKSAKSAKVQSGCNVPCEGNPDAKCGGFGRVQLYSKGNLPSPSKTSTKKTSTKKPATSTKSTKKSTSTTTRKTTSKPDTSTTAEPEETSTTSDVATTPSTVKPIDATTTPKLVTTPSLLPTSIVSTPVIQTSSPLLSSTTVAPVLPFTTSTSSATTSSTLTSSGTTTTTSSILSTPSSTTASTSTPTSGSSTTGTTTSGTTTGQTTLTTSFTSTSSSSGTTTSSSSSSM